MAKCPICEGRLTLIWWEYGFSAFCDACDRALGKMPASLGRKEARAQAWMDLAGAWRKRELEQRRLLRAISKSLPEGYKDKILEVMAEAAQTALDAIESEVTKKPVIAAREVGKGE